MESFRRGLSRIAAKIRRAAIIDERTLREIVRDIQRELLRADVSVDIVAEVSRRVEERVRGERLPPGFSKRELLLKVFYDELVRMLGGEEAYRPKVKRGRAYVVMLVGIQGSGKTTTAAKLALFYKRRGYRVGLVCADNFRPGAVQQLSQLAEQVGVDFYGVEGAGSAVDVARRGVELFRSKGYDIVVVDTAGRHKEERGLLEEMRVMAEAVRPDEVMLVLDGTIGKQAGPQAEAFHEAAPVGSIVVTKLDGAARGGGALAAVARTGARIAFIGTGEKVEELEPFDPPSFVSRLLGMGDLAALVERFRAAEILDRRRAEAVASGRFTLLDMKAQIESLEKLGPLKKLLELLPGGIELSPGLERMGEENLKKWKAVLNSMTVEELVNPDIIDRSRMVRIARGSGVGVRDVRDLLAAYRKSKKLIRKLARQRRGLRGIGRLGV